MFPEMGHITKHAHIDIYVYTHIVIYLLIYDYIYWGGGSSGPVRGDPSQRRSVPEGQLPDQYFSKMAGWSYRV